MLKNLLIWFLLIGANVFAQTLPRNIGFEAGSLNGWNCKTGKIDTTGQLTIADSYQIADRHVVYKKDEIGDEKDRFGGFPKICPGGGKYSVRLGNEQTGAEAESIYYTFFVPADATLGYSITFNYAVVFQNPDHKDYEQPRFTARVYDVAANQYVNCPYLEFAASSALPGFQLSTVKASNSSSAGLTDVYFKDWSSATIDLSQYLGKLMRIEFITNDCTKGGHFGYAYIDVDEDKSTSPVTGNVYCAGQADITLKGPEGFYGYKWFDSANQLVSQSQHLSLSPPPPDFTSYRLSVLPYPGLGCPSDFKTEVVRRADDFKLVVHDQTGCPETGVDLTLPAVTAGSTDGLAYTYFTDASLRNHVQDSTKISLSGTYYILAKAESGCADVKTVKVTFTPPDIQVSDPPAVRYPETVDITKAYKPKDGLTYAFFNDADATIPLVNYTAINKTGTYFIKAKNDVGCQQITSVKVEVLPPLPFVVTVPNAFTPNNDGVNDRFGVNLEGFVKFNSIDIFNRNGQLMFSTRSISDLWDGNFNGRPLPIGTYYWVFNGLDTYYNKAVTKNGYVSIVR